MHLPKLKDQKKTKFALGVAEEKLGSAIHETLQINCQKNDNVNELFRGIRQHFPRFLKELKDGDLEKAQLALGRAYSRGKCKFNINRVDNMIIQSISLLDQIDKDVNTFAMRVREWYSWHFPELIRIVPENIPYAHLVQCIKNKNSLSEENLPELELLCAMHTGDASKAKLILEAAKHSMGTDISIFDIANIERFATRVIDLAAYRKKLHKYLLKKMNDIAPNLSALIGELIGARLIAHAGSLINLAKCPASTIQILGAEKALFRALKTRGNTPKYGLIFHSSAIGKAAAKNRGRISRYLANKCAIAARIDSFSDVSTSKFGETLKEQVEERLKFYDTGVQPRKNIDVMQQAVKALIAEGNIETQSKKRLIQSDASDDEGPAKKKSKKKKKEKQNKEKPQAMEIEKPKEVEKEKEAPKESKKKKKDKKSKK